MKRLPTQLPLIQCLTHIISLNLYTYTNETGIIYNFGHEPQRGKGIIQRHRAPNKSVFLLSTLQCQSLPQGVIPGGIWILCTVWKLTLAKLLFCFQLRAVQSWVLYSANDRTRPRNVFYLRDPMPGLDMLFGWCSQLLDLFPYCVCVWFLGGGDCFFKVLTFIWRYLSIWNSLDFKLSFKQQPWSQCQMDVV